MALPTHTLFFLFAAVFYQATYPLSKMMILSVQAGMFKSVAVLVGLVLSLGCPGITHDNPGIKKLLFAAAFPVGLILVTLYSAELFTSSVLVLPPSYLVGKIKFKNMMKSLVVVFIGNFVGSLLFAYFMGHLSGVLEDEPWRSGLISFVEKKVFQLIPYARNVVTSLFILITRSRTHSFPFYFLFFIF